MSHLYVIGDLMAPKKPGDVGYDVPVQVRKERQTWYDKLFSFFVGEPVYAILPFGMRSISSGVRIAIPSGRWCKLEARSSARNRKLVIAGGGVIDWGYRGELFAVLLNMAFLPRVIRSGERYVQAIFFSQELHTINYTADFIDDTDRGSQGFGSTGR